MRWLQTKSGFMDKYLLALSQVDGLGPATLKKLLGYFNSAEALYHASFFDLKQAGLNPKIIKGWLATKGKVDPDALLKTIQQLGISVCTIFDASYPSLLKEIYDPPLILYYRGNLELFKRPALAVVGSRKISFYAKQIMPIILEPVIRGGVAIVSGLAYGVDGLSHELAVEFSGHTVGVVGSGLNWDILYPQGHIKLAKRILKQGGLLISEYPPNAEAMNYSFPRRNRIIAGLASATLIVEAGQKSGALITADCALENNREVLAVPQNIVSANSAGVNWLIKNGAKPITGPEDIMEIFHLSARIVDRPDFLKKLIAGLNADERKIYQALSPIPVHIDKIIENCNLNTSLVNGLLIQLELKGLIKHLGGQNYIKIGNY